MRKNLLYLSILCMGLFSHATQVYAAEDIIVELEETTEGDGTIDQNGAVDQDGNEGENGNVTESIQKGWICDEKGWIYIDENGNQVKNCWKEINGKYYWFENTGIMASDMWIGDFYVDSSGAWIPDEQRYQEGWIQSGNSWWYQYADGSYATNWKYINQVWYYFDDYGWMQTGWENIGGTWYYMSETGAMQTGWQSIGGTWYYMSETGAMQTGWQSIGGTWYYMSETGAMQTGWQSIGGTWYYMSETGAMQTGWQNIGGTWYYMSETGAMQTGWQSIGGTWYYMSESGVMQTGLQFIGDDIYILEATGAMVANQNYNFNGGNLSIGADGRVEKQTAFALKKAYNKLNQVGWDLRKAFNWSAGIPYYRMQNYGIGPQKKDIHSVWYANYGFDNNKGNCYVMAATFCYMARLLGYETYFVEGQVPLAVGGMGPHGWCEIVIDGFTYVFDPDFTNNTGRNGFQIYYGMSGTWRYSNYKRVA